MCAYYRYDDVGAVRLATLEVFSYLRGYMSVRLEMIVHEWSRHIATDSTRAALADELADLARLNTLNLEELIIWRQHQHKSR